MKNLKNKFSNASIMNALLTRQNTRYKKENDSNQENTIKNMYSYRTSEWCY